MINKRKFCAAKLVKSANYSRRAFFGKSVKIMLVLVTNYAQNYVSTIAPTKATPRHFFPRHFMIIARKFTRHHETAERILGRMALRRRLGLFGETV